MDSLNRGFCSEQGSDQARLNDHGEMVTPTRSGDSGFGLYVCKCIGSSCNFISSTPLGLGSLTTLSPIKKIRDELYYFFNAAKRLNFSNLSSSER